MFRLALRSLFSLLLLATPAWAAVPTISTGVRATNIAGGSVTLTARVTANGQPTAVVFNLGTTTNYGTVAAALPTLAAADSNVLVSSTVTGLVPGTTYQFNVVATNSDGTRRSTNYTFVQTADSPTLTITQAPTHSGNVATVNGSVITAGLAGRLYYEYGPTTAYGFETPAAPNDAIAANLAAPVNSNQPLPGGSTFHYRLVFKADLPSTLVVATPDGLSNQSPNAVNDSEEIAGNDPLLIDVLANDTDPENDTFTLQSVTQGKSGTVAIAGGEVRYTPNANFTGTDRFTYTIRDALGATDTATVTIRTLRSALSGTRGGLIKKANGKENGYFTLTTTATGAFSGIAMIRGERYILTGFLDNEGKFKGFATGDDGVIPVTLTTKNLESGATITATFDNGSYTADLSVSENEATRRAEVRGRYTMGIAAGGTGPSNGNDPGTPPGGSGWATLRVREDGTASIKGRLADGRSFSTKGTVNLDGESAVFTFFDLVKDTRVVGELTLADSLTGTVQIDRRATGEGRFPRGFDLVQTADGARYQKPRDNRRVLDTEAGTKGQDLTISFTGGNLAANIERTLFLDDEDRVTVVDKGGEGLKMKIDRSSGRFRAGVTIDNSGTRVRATGVLVQSTDGGAGRGIGTFTTATDTGTVTISAAGSGGSSGGSGGGTTPPATTP